MAFGGYLCMYVQESVCLKCFFMQNAVGSK